MNKLILLDRDGVINEPLIDRDVLSWEDFTFISGSLEGIKILKQLGYKIGICTNQSAINKGLCEYKDVADIHTIMQEAIRTYTGSNIEHICTCPHTQEQNCACRKPKPNMLENVIKFYNTHPSTVWFVGDQVSDMQSARNANCRFCFVKSGRGDHKDVGPLSDMICDNLLDFANQIRYIEKIYTSNNMLAPYDLLGV